MTAELLKVFENRAQREKNRETSRKHAFMIRQNAMIDAFTQPVGATRAERDIKSRTLMIHWLDYLVVNKELVKDTPTFATQLRRMLNKIAKDPQLRARYDPFDWHYWQLFGEPLVPGMPVNLLESLYELTPPSKNAQNMSPPKLENVRDIETETSKEKKPTRSTVTEADRDHLQVLEFLEIIKECFRQEYGDDGILDELSLESTLEEFDFDLVCYAVLSDYLTEMYPTHTDDVFILGEIPQDLCISPLECLYDALFHGSQ